MAEDLPGVDQLREILAELAAEDAPELLTEARVAARARARTLIEDTLVEEFLRAVSSKRTGAQSRAAQAAQAQAAQAQAAQRPAARRRAQTSVSAPRAAPGGDAWWAYCVIAASERDAAPVGVPGVEQSGAVELIEEGELTALVSRVSLAEFSDERLREHLNDVEWVERVARAHEAVLERALEHATLLPLRLCTLYQDREGVSRMLREQQPVLLQALQNLEGRREWGLKLFVDVDRLAQWVDDDPSASAAASSSGTAYMARRRRERHTGERVRELGDAAAQDVHVRLERIADAAQANPLQRPEVHGRDARMLLNSAYLVAREREHELDAMIASLREQWQESGFELELTGPWPPYNFVSTSAMVIP